MSRYVPIAVLTALLAPCALACGNSQPNNPPPQQPQYYGGQYPPPQGTAYPTTTGYPPSPQPYPTQTAPGPNPSPYPPAPGPAPSPGPTPPGPLPPGPAPSGGGGTAQPLPASAAGAAVAILNTAASTDAAGMSPEGSGMAGQFVQGQTLSTPITIAPGKCYTFIAGGVGPQQIQISIVAQTPIPGMSPTLGQQSGAAPKVTFGAGSNCFKLALSPFPVQASFVITAAQGGGIIAGQAYSK